MANKPMRFVNSNDIWDKATRAFEKEKQFLLKLMPIADIQHVGSTAIPGALTKGDLDIQVRVSESIFKDATEKLKLHYKINHPEIWRDGFASFQNYANPEIPIGIQLTVKDSAYDDFYKVRDLFTKDAQLLKKYNAMKRSFEGKSVIEYKKAKKELFGANGETKLLKNIPIFTVHLPEYKVDDEPEHEEIGKVVDDEIKKHFMGQTILIRALGSMEHSGKSIDEMVEIIKTTGTDRYDPERVGDRYANIEGKYIDFYALRRTISPKTKLFWQLSWSFYTSPLKTRGYPVRVDIITIYDPKQLKAVVHQPENHPHVKRDGFVFKDPINKLGAIKAIFKITD